MTSPLTKRGGKGTPRQTNAMMGNPTVLMGTLLTVRDFCTILWLEKKSLDVVDEDHAIPFIKNNYNYILHFIHMNQYNL